MKYLLILDPDKRLFNVVNFTGDTPTYEPDLHFGDDPSPVVDWLKSMIELGLSSHDLDMMHIDDLRPDDDENYN